MIIIVAVVVAAATYVVVSFYRIEHTYSHDNKLLLTRQVQLQHNLDKYNESLELIMNQILECHSKDKGRLYILKELPSSDALSIVMDECNVSYAQINREVDEVTFYQTALISNDEVTLSYVGTREDNGKTTWSITKKFPDFARKETIGVKIYNFAFNRGVV